jgi:hypothetical protein
MYVWFLPFYPLQAQLEEILIQGFSRWGNLLSLPTYADGNRKEKAFVPPWANALAFFFGGFLDAPEVLEQLTVL